jgi:hypothetical protein
MINKYKVESNGEIVHKQKASVPPILNVAKANQEIERLKQENEKLKATEQPKASAVKNEFSEALHERISNLSQPHYVKELESRVEMTYKAYEPLVPVSKAPVSYIVSQNYHLCYDNGQVLFMKPQGKGVTEGTLPTILRKPLDGCSGSGRYSIKQSVSETQDKSYKGYIKPMGSNLTQAEYDNIIKGKPSIDDLLAVYDQYSNDSVNIDISKAIPVW